MKKKTCQTGDNGTENVEIAVLSNHLCNFWRIVEMSLIKCEINLILDWSANFVILSIDITI